MVQSKYKCCADKGCGGIFAVRDRRAALGCNRHRGLSQDSVLNCEHGRLSPGARFHLRKDLFDELRDLFLSLLKKDGDWFVAEPVRDQLEQAHLLPGESIGRAFMDGFGNVGTEGDERMPSGTSAPQCIDLSSCDSILNEFRGIGGDRWYDAGVQTGTLIILNISG